jgi:hypothetical protein
MAETTTTTVAVDVAAGPERLAGVAGRIAGADIMGRRALLAEIRADGSGARWGKTTPSVAAAGWKIVPGTYVVGNGFAVRVNRDGNRAEFLPVYRNRIIRGYMANGFGAAMMRRVFPFLTARGAAARGATLETNADGFVLVHAARAPKTPDPTPEPVTPDADADVTPDPEPVHAE